MQGGPPRSLYAFHALRAPVAHTPKTVHRFYQYFDSQGLRCEPDQGGIKPPCQPSSKTRVLQGTSRSVCTPLLVTLIRSIHSVTSRITGSLALSIAYGIQADTPDDKYLRLFREMMRSFTEASVPGTFVVDVLPFRESNHLNVGYGQR